MREVALDTETTGLDPFTGHRIVEIGCVELWSRIRTGKTFQAYLNPERDMPEEAFMVHGLSSDFLAGKPLFAHVVEELLAFIGSDPLIIHNAQFDLRFLNFELELLGHPPIHHTRAVDTVSVARLKFPGSPVKLDALCKRFDIDLSARTKHGALLDAELLADVYLELMGGRQESMFLAAEITNEQIAAEIASAQNFPYRQFVISDEEFAAHNAFVAKIKNALWLSEVT